MIVLLFSKTVHVSSAPVSVFEHYGLEVGLIVAYELGSSISTMDPTGTAETGSMKS